MKNILFFLVAILLLTRCKDDCNHSESKEFLFVQVAAFAVFDTEYSMCLPPQVMVDYFCENYNYIAEEHRIEHFCEPIDFSDSLMVIIGNYALNPIYKVPYTFKGYDWYHEDVPSGVIEGITPEGLVFFRIGGNLRKLELGEEYNYEIEKVDTTIIEPWDDVFLDTESGEYMFYNFYGQLLPFTDTCVLITTYHYYISNEGFFNQEDIQFIEGYGIQE